MESIVKNYLHGIISEEEAVEVLGRKHGLTPEEAAKAIAEITAKVTAKAR